MDTSIRTVLPPKPRKLHEKADEVRRRKEAAERLIKERHEAVRRQREERIMKINEERLRQQRELKERHAKELKRQQDVLQRRMALMERDNARKKEILEKNHAAASRLVNAPSRKKYAFGSSTPRELSFVECKQPKNQEKHQLREKQLLSTSMIHGQHGRSENSVMSTSMYVPSDSSRQSNSALRLPQSKLSVTKSHNLMTQSVFSPSTKLSVTPTARLQRKRLNQLTTSASNSPLANSCESPEVQAKLSKAKESNFKPKLKSGVLVSSSIQNRSPSSTEHPNDAPMVMHAFSEQSDATVAVGARNSGTLDIENLPNANTSKISDVNTHVEVGVNVVSLVRTFKKCYAHFFQEGFASPIHIPSTEQQAKAPLSEETPGNFHCENKIAEFLPENKVEEQVMEPKNRETAGNLHCESRVTEFLPEAEVEKQDKQAHSKEATGKSPCDNRIIEFPLEDEVQKQDKEVLNREAAISSHCADRTVDFMLEDEFTKQTKELLTEEIPEKLYRENRTMEFPGESESNIVLADKPAETRQPVIENRYNVIKVSITNYGIEAYSDGLQNQSAPVISGDIPGTVPIIKEVDDSMTRKLPSPPNEFVAHRLRREQEQRELDERKARIAAILAKSRDLSSGTPVIGRTSPSRGETAQDLLKRLASNGNLPSLQKLVARHTSEPSAIDQDDRLCE
ncbi:hypothetical protein Angca_000108 [Angiostrongylus cantonensis]|nr:hypothetical protein Angca_000108 [Angiostrongylus cantonensis]